MDAWQMWLIAGIALIIIEIFTPGFVLLSFGVGCLLASLASALDSGFWLQILSFGIGTLLVFFGIRPVVKKYLQPTIKTIPTNIDALVGKIARVIEKIDNDKDAGRVKIGGEDWRAISQDDRVFKTGESVKIVRVEGAKVYVTHI